MKTLEVIATRNSGQSKITIAKDQVRLKVGPDDPNLDRLKEVAEFCRYQEVDQTLRGKLSETTLSHGVAVLYTCAGQVGGYIYLAESPMRFSLKEIK